MDVKTLEKQLKQAHPAPVYLVLGTQQTIQDEVKKAFLKLIPDDQKTMNVGSYDMEEESLASALDDATSVPFFGEQRLVFLNKPHFLTTSKANGKIKQDPDLLKNYLKTPQPTTILVISAPFDKLDGRKGVVKELKKVAVEVSAQPLNENEARKQVEAQVLSDHYTFGDGALDELVKRTNADFGLMISSIKQLEILTYKSKEIKVEDIKGLVKQSLDENVFDLVNAVLNKQQEYSLDLYQQLIEGQQQPLQINAILVSQFRLLLQLKILVARGLSQGTIAQKLSAHPYRVKLGLQTIRNFSLTSLMNAYLGLIRIERALKTTSRAPELLFQLFMLQYAQMK